ncbi:hypothetical protein [Lysobacter enzymogenes]|uniref:DUF7832 domain-containing protein n=1 Tax=Lysobacter enzymogenes TaxID=69 RepID=UPI0008977990|nr:hypothetical protein [Lysobacter enzymogenes]SDW69634.1 hypothetical protein SAMN05421681_102579 [Lysobacter enzymogenes]
MTATDLTDLLLDALGKRIDDPAAVALAQALGSKPFKNATPGNTVHLRSRKLGIEVGASMQIDNRAFFPPRKDGRRWVTWVSHAFVYPNYRGALPDGFDWSLDDAALSARFRRRVEGGLEEVRYTLPPPREGLRAKATLDEDDNRPRHLLLAVAEEADYATVYPGADPAHSVEDGFFAAWCALHGMLREDRLGADALAALRERRITPLALLCDALGGLLWENDVRPEHAAFCHAYAKRLMEPDEACALCDAQAVFGDSNAWRKPGEAMTQDRWDEYDRIAPRYAQRWQQWRDGEIRSIVDHPHGADATS